MQTRGVLWFDVVYGTRDTPGDTPGMTGMPDGVRQGPVGVPRPTDPTRRGRPGPTELGRRLQAGMRDGRRAVREFLDEAGGRIHEHPYAISLAVGDDARAVRGPRWLP